MECGLYQINWGIGILNKEMSSFAFGLTTRLRFALNDKIVFSRLIIPEGKSKESRDINLALDNIKAQIIDKENEAFAKRVGKDRSLSTYQKYLTVRKYLAEFIKVHYKRTDIAMNELTEDFIRDYCLYLRNEVGLAQSSVWIYSIPLKHIVTTAHYNGKIARNPFAQYKVDPDHKERGFLTEDELRAFTTIELNNPDLELARYLD